MYCNIKENCALPVGAERFLVLYLYLMNKNAYVIVIIQYSTQIYSISNAAFLKTGVNRLIFLPLENEGQNAGQAVMGSQRIQSHSSVAVMFKKLSQMWDVFN